MNILQEASMQMANNLKEEPVSRAQSARSNQLASTDKNKFLDVQLSKLNTG